MTYFNSKVHRLGNWAHQEFDHLPLRNVTHFKRDVTQPGFYSAEDMGKESWIKTAGKILIFVVPIIPFITFVFIIRDERAWSRYLKTADFQERKNNWDALFVKNGQGEVPYEYYNRVLEALVRTGIQPNQLRFRKINLRSEEAVNDQPVIQQGIERREILHLLCSKSLNSERDERIYRAELEGSTLYTLGNLDMVDRVSKSFHQFLKANLV